MNSRLQRARDRRLIRTPLRLMWKIRRFLFLTGLIVFIGWGINYLAPHAISPVAKAELDSPVPTATPTPTQLDRQVAWIAEFAQKYARPEIGKSKSLVTYQLACLAHKENGYHSNDHCGDNGLACGEFQFHESTWEGFRTDMMKQDLVASMSSRLDDRDATETTAWAITHGHDNDWGPLLRGECQ